MCYRLLIDRRRIDQIYLSREILSRLKEQNTSSAMLPSCGQGQWTRRSMSNPVVSAEGMHTLHCAGPDTSTPHPHSKSTLPRPPILHLPPLSPRPQLPFHIHPTPPTLLPLQLLAPQPTVGDRPNMTKETGNPHIHSFLCQSLYQAASYVHYAQTGNQLKKTKVYPIHAYFSF